MKHQEILNIRQDIGLGKPIVLLHGMFGDGTQWDKIVEILKNDYRVISVDLLGHGKSPRPNGAQYTVSEHVLYLRKTLEKLNATEQLTVVGYSMGGSVALSYAKKYQQEVIQLYLLSTPFYLKPEQMVAAHYSGSLLLTKSTSGLFRMLEKLLGDGKLDWLLRYGNDSRTFHKMIGAHDNKLESDIVRMNLKELVRQYDFAGNLTGLSVPLTYYAGKKDTFVVQGQVNALKQFNKNMHIQRLDIIKVDHMLVQNLPHQIANYVLANKSDILHIGYDEGNGEPIVLLHGIESSSTYWRGVIPVLSQKHRVIALDLLGFGKSPKPLNIAYSLDDQVKWVQKTLRNIGVNKYKVIGHSLGSLVALALAAKEPDCVVSQTLVSPVFVAAKNDSNNILLGKFSYIEKISDSSYVYSKTTRAIGDKRIIKYLPSLRTLDNAIKEQHVARLAKQSKCVPTTIIYGTADPLIDTNYTKNIAKYFKHSSVIELPKLSHNFVMYKPTLLIENLGNEYSNLNVRPKTLPKLPPTFAKQLVKLAMPILCLKSLLYVSAGLLLFSDFAPWVLTFGLAYFVIMSGYDIIRGAFSLRNEHLSYAGYVGLGLVTIIIGYGLFRHQELSVKIAVFTICGLVFLMGITRLIVGVLWAHSKRLRRSLVATGLFMSIAGLLAVTGGVISIYIIIYTIAILLIVYGLQFGIYAAGAFTMAYIRGFNKN